MAVLIVGLFYLVILEPIHWKEGIPYLASAEEV